MMGLNLRFCNLLFSRYGNEVPVDWFMRSKAIVLASAILLVAIPGSTVRAQTKFGTIFPPLNDVLINSLWSSGKFLYDFDDKGKVTILLRMPITVMDRFGHKGNVEYKFLYVGEWRHEYRAFDREERRAFNLRGTKKIKAHFLTMNCRLINFIEPVFSDGTTVNDAGQYGISWCKRAASELKAIRCRYVLNERRRDAFVPDTDPRRVLAWYTLQDDIQLSFEPDLKQIPFTELLTRMEAIKKK
jgi:hypothetical protein